MLPPNIVTLVAFVIRKARYAHAPGRKEAGITNGRGQKKYAESVWEGGKEKLRRSESKAIRMVKEQL